jgi:N-acetyl-1-D-myo-inositol-2-amino-2-deoxy-alpha-D-glucopyranoside deacetylase
VTTPDGGQRMLLVHAHPDDESIGTGATMSKYAAEGAGVTLVTCTLGELGEIIPPELAHLAADADGGLGEYRVGELDAACAALGVTDHRFLGGAGRWRDSGMMGLPSNDAPDCFWQADVDEAAGELLRVIREVRPQVLISYDDNGFYGHPDHIQAHRVARRAFELADGQVAKFYATAVPRSVLAAGIEEMRRAAQRDGRPLGGVDLTRAESAEDLPFGVPDDQVTTEIDATAYLDQKLAAMRAHATQIAVDSPFFALSNNVGQRAFGRECYTLLSGPRGPGSGPHGRESDLFSGIG